MTQTGRPCCASLAVHFEEKRPHKRESTRFLFLPNGATQCGQAAAVGIYLHYQRHPERFPGSRSVCSALLLKSRVITRPLCLRALHYTAKGCALSAAAASHTAAAATRPQPRCSFQQRKESIARAEKTKQKKTHRCLWHLIDAKSAVAISIAIVSRPR